MPLLGIFDRAYNLEKKAIRFCVLRYQTDGAPFGDRRMKELIAKVEVIGSTEAVLGESVCWLPEEGAVLWVDIVSRRVFRTRVADGVTHHWDFYEQTGFVQPADDGTWLVGQENAVLRFDPATGAQEIFVSLEASDPTTRTNDAGCDPQGRLLVGTMRMVERGGPAPIGSLYRIDGHGRVETLDRGLKIPNGIAFSPNGDTIYWAETYRDVRQVWSAPCDATGKLGEKRCFVRLDEGLGRPDGAAVDEEGCYWVAAAWGWRLLRYTPDGQLDTIVRLPVERPSKLAFGGPDLCTIFITSISEGLAPDADKIQPLAGRLIAVDLGIAGLPPVRFRTG